VLLLYLGFLGASMATHDGRHIRVDAVRKGLKGPGYHLYNALSDLLALGFTAFLGVMAVGYTGMLLEKGFMQEAARLPQWLAAFPIALAFGLMTLRFGLKIVESTRSWLRREPAPELAPELH
jgi:TRAP-type C4-dicarboxylate transport system permease small subunit